MLSAVWLGDAPQSLIRTVLPTNMTGEKRPEQGASIRIVSLNCLHKISAVKEIRSLEPDVVLTQESPDRKSMQSLLDTDYAGYQLLWSPDTAMLVRGSVVPIDVPRPLTRQYVLAAVSLENGSQFNVASIRLIPSPLRFDIWNPSAWQQFADNRRMRRQQLTAIYQQVASATSPGPTILGGDFNAPARDAIFEILKPDLRDGWPAAGRSWGKTIVNNAPVHRIDQIWISPQFAAESVTAKKSINSDHRMVIGDYWLHP
jgi:endonuclease/exonuclease/phosphatase (EEP) superfamily protein YafD